MVSVYIFTKKTIFATVKLRITIYKLNLFIKNE